MFRLVPQAFSDDFVLAARGGFRDGTPLVIFTALQ